jgi:hypothetical protein
MEPSLLHVNGENEWRDREKSVLCFQVLCAAEPSADVSVGSPTDAATARLLHHPGGCSPRWAVVWWQGLKPILQG